MMQRLADVVTLFVEFPERSEAKSNGRCLSHWGQRHGGRLQNILKNYVILNKAPEETTSGQRAGDRSLEGWLARREKQCSETLAC